jgi:tellurite resistance protein TerC
MTTPPSPVPAGADRRRAAAVALGCLAAGLAVGAGFWVARGPELGQQYLAGYLIELSLSVDNVFVFVLVFAEFGLGARRQQTVLFWGLLGAVVLRTACLLAGLGAIGRFQWLVPAFGALILLTGLRLAFSPHARHGAGTRNALARFVGRRLPVALAALVVIEAADLVFALDSLPAVLAVTHDPAVAVASNLMAILGLRSLYSIVSGALQGLRYLNAGLAGVLAFVGAKMLAERWHPVPTWLSLAVIAGVLGVAVGASLLRPWPKP